MVGVDARHGIDFGQSDAVCLVAIRWVGLPRDGPTHYRLPVELTVRNLNSIGGRETGFARHGGANCELIPASTDAAARDRRRVATGLLDALASRSRVCIRTSAEVVDLVAQGFCCLRGGVGKIIAF